MTAISGSAAAVTGAASGIGRALALELAKRGCDLALADRDEAGLQTLAAEIGRDGGRKVSVHKVDVGEAGQIQEFATAAIAASTASCRVETICWTSHPAPCKFPRTDHSPNTTPNAFA